MDMTETLVVLLNKRGPVYDEYIRYFINNEKMTFPDMKRHNKTFYLLLSDIWSLNNKFIRKIGEPIFELKEERTKNNRLSKVVFKNAKLKITECDNDFEFELPIENINISKKKA